MKSYRHDYRLTPESRRAFTLLTLWDAAWKTAALVSVAKRDPEQVVGGKKTPWVVALTLVNSAGLLPLTYFLLQRKYHG